MSLADGGDGGQGQGPGLDGDGGRGPVQQREHLFRHLQVAPRLLLEERDHPDPGHPPPVYLAQHRGKIGHQAPDVAGLSGGKPVKVVGHRELRRRGRVLGEPQQQLGAVLLAEVAAQQLAPQGLHVGAHAVLDRHQHVQGEMLLREALPQELEGPGPGVFPR